MFEQNGLTANTPPNKSGSATEILKEFASRNDRQRGLWSFLTWSFFLAQIVAAEEFLGGGAAHASQHIDGVAHDANDASGSSGDPIGYATAGSIAGTQEDGQTNPQNALQAAEQAHQDVHIPGMEYIPVVGTLDGPGADEVQAANGAVSAAAMSDELPGDGSGSEDGGSPGNGADSGDTGSGPDDGITIGDIHIPSDILPDLGLITDPVAELLDNTLSDVVPSLLDTTVATLDDLFGAVDQTTDNLGQFLSDVGDVVGGGLDGLLPGAGTAVAELTHTLDNVLDSTTPLVELVQDTTGSLLDGLGTVASAGGDLIQGLLGSSGALSFAHEHIDVANAPNDMSTGAIHSDYRVALETTVEDVVTPISDIGNGVTGTLSSVVDKIIGGDHGDGSDTAGGSGDHASNGLADALHHVHLPIFGDLA